jgi:hypothetical protein
VERGRSTGVISFHRCGEGESGTAAGGGSRMDGWNMPAKGKKDFAMSPASLREVFTKTSRTLYHIIAKTFLYHREDFFMK